MADAAAAEGVTIRVRVHQSEEPPRVQLPSVMACDQIGMLQMGAELRVDVAADYPAGREDSYLVELNGGSAEPTLHQNLRQLLICIAVS